MTSPAESVRDIESVPLRDPVNSLLNDSAIETVSATDLVSAALLVTDSAIEIEFAVVRDLPAALTAASEIAIESEVDLVLVVDLLGESAIETESTGPRASDMVPLDSDSAIEMLSDTDLVLPAATVLASESDAESLVDLGLATERASDSPIEAESEVGLANDIAPLASDSAIEMESEPVLLLP